jgi:hypothetical protein
MKRILLFLSLCAGIPSFAQQGGSDDWYIRGAYNFGVILQHHNNMGNLINGFINGMEINYVKPTTGNQLWHYENNFPERGFGFTYFDLGNPKELGNLYAMYGFYDIPLNKKPKPFRLYMRLSPGIAYTPVYFDPIFNHKNNVISSPVNAYVNFKWYYRWDINTHFRWEFGLNFSHSSNGRENLPNLGLNLVTINTGFVYKFLYDRPTELKIDSSTKVKSKNELLAYAVYGVNQIDVLGPKYMSQGYSLAYYRNKRNTHKFGGGVELFYNPANLAQLEMSGDTVKKLQNLQVGVKFSYCYNIGRLSLPVEFGYYAYTHFTGDGPFYHRIGVRYIFKNNVVAMFQLKTHWAVAQYFEFGAGYRLPLKT